jgi:pyrroloquinoline quinone biosynthesis protein D
MSEPGVFDPDAVIDIAPIYRFQWEEAQGCHVLLYPEGMIRLNESAGEVLKYCDGSRGFLGVVEALQRAFPDADLEADVREFLEVAHGRGWIRVRRV